MNLNELENKRVLILGFGREGIDTFKFLRRVFLKKVLGVGDRNENVKCQMSNVKKVRWHLGKDYLKAIKNYDIIIKSPGVPAKILRKFRRASQIITSQTEIFFENCPGKIVGVTGTKGKSTTASLIYRILKVGGIKVHLIGNIGKPVLNLLFSARKNDVYVYELSSHQLFNLKKSPHISVFLNIYPEHSDYYKNFKEYVAAKANIARYQTKDDFLIYNIEDKIVREIAEKSKAKKIPIPTNPSTGLRMVSLPNHYEFVTNIRIPLVGKFNLKNLMAAIAVGKIFGVPPSKIAIAIKNFKPLPHRLEYVGTFRGIKFYNDSLATVPEATVKAIEALGKNLKTIILGGFERGQDFKNLAKKILESKIENLIFFPETGQRIWLEILKRKGEKKIKAFFTKEMKEAVKMAYQNTKKGEICLLSPASASFNLFKDYKERGNLFKKWVKIFGK